jgi:hypothetical protein
MAFAKICTVKAILYLADVNKFLPVLSTFIVPFV